MNINELVGKTLSDVQGLEPGSDYIVFATTDGSEYLMLHHQDCCERVSVEEVHGDVADLIGTPILVAEEVSDYEGPRPDHEYVDSYTWTFYRITTIKGTVTIRWLGESNGYYSERVDFEKVGHDAED